jgi:cytoskeletal protein RodZ
VDLARAGTLSLLKQGDKSSVVTESTRDTTRARRIENMMNKIVAMVMASALAAGVMLWQAPASAEEPTDAPKAEKDKAAKKEKKAEKKAAKKEAEEKGEKKAE